MIGLVLNPAKSFKALQLVRIQCPVNCDNAKKEQSLDVESARIFKIAEEDVTLKQVLSNIQVNFHPCHPFRKLDSQ